SSSSSSKDSSTKIADEQPYIKIKKVDSIYLQNAHTESNNNFINIKQNTANITNNKYNTKSITKKFNIDFLYKNNIFKLYNNSITFALTILFISSISIYLFNMDTSIKTNSKNIIVYENKNVKTKKNNILDKNKHLPQYVKYKTLNNEKLKKYLYTKNSLLADEPYFSSIISSAEEFDINPLILFAITGQEQGFVPKSNKSAKKIGNNPFNVFHSWEEYNSDIKDSSRIAGRTVFNLLKTMPKGQDPFKWVNNTYAEDINWWKGVKSLFNELEKAVK
ncbi:glucosaminidase domain-containing protein, partial [Clostridium botulinum]|nr:glucosaminidase domain-containing protein [Clostridium botulinum]